MGSISVTMFMTLDGVVQAPGRPDEDTRGGFTHGGWGQPYNDEVLGREMGQAMGRPGDMLFGHRTWDDFRTAWGRATHDNPFSTYMNAATKYVVSRGDVDVDAWQHSILLRGDAVETVGRLKAESDRELGIIGSVSLVQSLHAARLIDRYTLVFSAAARHRHPAVRGDGAHDGARADRQRADRKGRDHRALRPPLTRR